MAQPARVSAPIPRPLPRVAPAPSASPCACGGTCPRCASSPRRPEQAVQATVSRPGQPLAPELRHRLQSQFKTDLSDVRLHTDAQAESAALQTHASAFVFGPHIVFGPSMYSPNTTAGYRRLAHEITHIIQQRGAPASQGEPSFDPVPKLESEAKTTAAKAGQDPHASLEVEPSPEAQGHVQRDDPPTPSVFQRPDYLHPWTSSGQFQFQMSPEMQRLMLEMQFQRWLEAQTAVIPPDAVPPLPTGGLTPGATGTPTVPVVQGPIIPSPTDAAAAAEDQGPIIPRARGAPARPAADTPGAGLPDMSALMAPYLARGVPLGSRDPGAALQLYQNAFNWVRLLPEPPAPFSRWVPGNWRVSLSESLAGMAMNNSDLRLDFPTPVENFDRQLLNMTNDPKTVPTYINLPALHFW